ncbi:MAG: aryl-sulfate sulfotransferase [Bacteroidota bacterium]
MNFKRIIISAFLILFLSNSENVFSQNRTVGLFINDTAKTFKGYTLFAPKQNTMTYLINNEGRIVHQWKASVYPPGQAVYLLDNGHLLRTCMIPGNLGTGGGEGGRVEEYDWNDSLIWYINYSTSTYMQHHDIKILPNGNIIMLVVEKKTMTEVIAAGFDTSKIQKPDFLQKQMLIPDCIIEIKPTLPSGGTVVWEWHVWDHLIQNFNPAKSNYGVPASHAELIDAAGDHKALPLFWNHMNSIDYNPAFDQIAVSVRGNSEVWIIDHSTTTLESKGHTGGKRGKGGDLLYRWGNPICYGAGTATDDKYFQQHDIEWVKPGYPGAGNITCFNNGVGRNYSTVDEITPPVDTAGNYTYVAGTKFGPANLTWTYIATPPTSLYGADISGAFRLPNGNTLINDGPHGTFYEVTSSGNVVWKYINPTVLTGTIKWNDTIPLDVSHPGEWMNSIFRVYRYPTNYSAFNGKTLTPGNFVELYPSTSIAEKKEEEQFNIYPNPTNDVMNISFAGQMSNQKRKLEIQITNMIGEVISKSYFDKSEMIKIDVSSLTNGLYFINVNGTFKKFIKQ